MIQVWLWIKAFWDRQRRRCLIRIRGRKVLRRFCKTITKKLKVTAISSCREIMWGWTQISTAPLSANRSLKLSTRTGWAGWWQITKRRLSRRTLTFPKTFRASLLWPSAKINLRQPWWGILCSRPRSTKWLTKRLCNKMSSIKKWVKWVQWAYRAFFSKNKWEETRAHLKQT